MTDLVVWGLGSLGRPVLDRIADRHPRRELVAVVRDPDRPPPLPPNVTAAGLEVLAGTAAPVLVCVADNEAEVLRPYLAGGRIEAGRAAVARRNLALLERHVETRHWKERPVLVVTNPVEPLCGYLAGAVGCRPVYGAGMQVDAERCRTVLAVGWHVRLAPDELPMTGTHGMTPVPVHSAVPGLARQVAGEP
ncbi:hypothetical protein, partial [Actinophytocola sp.]|uniref:hypothetical protein n=1 Tax=Actinophytocola sp. TaxID=1872138 RepID=UPI002D809C3A